MAGELRAKWLRWQARCWHQPARCLPQLPANSQQLPAAGSELRHGRRRRGARINSLIDSRNGNARPLATHNDATSSHWRVAARPMPRHRWRPSLMGFARRRWPELSIHWLAYRPPRPINRRLALFARQRAATSGPDEHRRASSCSTLIGSRLVARGSLRALYQSLATLSLLY